MQWEVEGSESEAEGWLDRMVQVLTYCESLWPEFCPPEPMVEGENRLHKDFQFTVSLYCCPDLSLPLPHMSFLSLS